MADTSSSKQYVRTFKLNPEKIDHLVRRLMESEKATTSSPPHFVEPFAGAIEALRIHRAQVVFGRRGSGKTSLLRKLEAVLRAENAPVAFVDINSHIRETREDSIISVWVCVLETFEAWRTETRATKDDSLVRVLQKLRHLASRPNSRRETEGHADLEQNETGISGGGRVGGPGWALGANGKRSKSQARRQSGSRSFNVTKASELDHLLPQIEQCLSLISRVSSSGAYVIVDDFYNLNVVDQPYVLDTLRRICQTTNTWLKIGTVRHRSNLFVTTSARPVGIQIPDDAAEIQLDKSLEHFAATKKFLREMLQGLLKDDGIAFDSLLSPTGFDRLVQASGGVARDFICILRESIAAARNRMAQYQAAGKDQTRELRVIADDIWVTTSRMSLGKRTNFKSKTDMAINRERLLEKVNQMLRASQQRGKNCVLIPNDLPDAQKTEIEILLDWKFIHLMDSRVQIDFKDYSSYMVDLGEQAQDPSMKGMVLDLGEERDLREIRNRKYIFSLDS